MNQAKEEEIGSGCLIGLIKAFFFMFSILSALIAIQEIFKHLIYCRTVIPKLESLYMKVENISVRSGGSRKRGMTQHFANGYLVNKESNSVTVEISSRWDMFAVEGKENYSVNYDTIIPLKNLYDEIITKKNNEEIFLTKAIMELDKVLPIWYYRKDTLERIHAISLLRFEADGEPYSISRKIKPLILYTLFLLPVVFFLGKKNKKK